MTLDNWKAIDPELEETNYAVYLYIIVCQFLLIPSFIAQACQIYSTILGV